MAAMLNLKQLTLALCVALVGAGMVSACGNDCKHLANIICGCQPTVNQQNRCNDAVSAANQNANLSNEQQNCCKSILEAGTCECYQIRDGNFAACGLIGDISEFPQFKCGQ